MPTVTAEELNQRSPGYLPGLVGMEVTEIGDKALRSRLALRQEVMATNGYLHAATVIALADTSCGYGTFAHLPAGATSWTTIELKANLIGTAREGSITCEATLAHGGRTTQVWDAKVFAPDGRTIALFRCTQLLIYPREGSK